MFTGIIAYCSLEYYFFYKGESINMSYYYKAFLCFISWVILTGLTVMSLQNVFDFMHTGILSIKYLIMNSSITAVLFYTSLIVLSRMWKNIMLQLKSKKVDLEAYTNEIIE